MLRFLILSVVALVVQGFNCPTCGRENCACYGPTDTNLNNQLRSPMMEARKGHMVTMTKIVEDVEYQQQSDDYHNVIALVHNNNNNNNNRPQSPAPASMTACGLKE